MINDILYLFILLIICVVIFILINFIPNNYIEYYIDKKMDKYGYEIVKHFICLMINLFGIIVIIILLIPILLDF